MRLALFDLAVLAIFVMSGESTAQPKTPGVDVFGDAIPEGAVGRIGSVRLQLPGRVHAVALSPDGKLLASLVSPITQDSLQFRGLFDGGSAIHLMDIESGGILRMIPFGGQCIHCLHDNRTVVCAGMTEFALFDLQTGARTTGRKYDYIRWGSGGLAISVSPDRKWLAAQSNPADYHSPVRLFDLKNDKNVIELPGRGSDCRALRFSSDGKRILLASVIPSSANGNSFSFDSNSKLALTSIDVAEKKILGEFAIGTSQNFALASDGETVAFETADRDKVRVFHLPTGKDRCVLSARGAAPAFSPDLKQLVTFDEKGTGVLWSVADGAKVRDLEGRLSNKDFRIAGISSDGKKLVVVDGGYQSAASVVVWNLETGKQAERPAGHSGAITCIAFSPDGKFLATGGVDCSVRLWDAKTSQYIAMLADCPHAIKSIVFSSDGKQIASACRSGSVQVIDVARREVNFSFQGPEKGATALAFSKDGKTLFAGGKEARLIAWDLTTGRETSNIKLAEGAEVLALSQGETIAITADSGQIFGRGIPGAAVNPEHVRLWTPGKNTPIEKVHVSSDDNGGVMTSTAAFAPNGLFFASSQVSEYQGIRPSYGKAMVRLWERGSGQMISVVAPSISEVLAISPNSRYVAAIAPGQSGHLRVGHGVGLDVWDVLTGEKAMAVKETPTCVAFTPDGTKLATAGRGSDVVFWNMPKPKTPTEGPAPAAKDLDEWWAKLSGDAKDAYKAIAALVDRPAPAVALLKDRLHPVVPAKEAAVAKLIAQLDSGVFSERSKAQAALEDLGESASHSLRAKMQTKIPLELRRRLESILEKTKETSARSVRERRAVAVLEWIDTPPSRALLEEYSRGAGDARLTAASRAALNRLRR